MSVLAASVITSFVAVIAGVVVAVTWGSLLGPVLIIGGIAGLGWVFVPLVIARFVHWLSMGR